MVQTKVRVLASIVPRQFLLSWRQCQCRDTDSRVSAAGMGTIAKNPADMGKAMVLSAMVETYAVLGFLISALVLFFI